MSRGRKQTFGSLVRQERERLKIGLREMARRIGMSPTYLSMIERGKFPPPAEDKITAIAQIIGSDRDELLALAGRVGSDLQRKIMEQPRVMAGLIREFSEVSREEDMDSRRKSLERSLERIYSAAAKAREAAEAARAAEADDADFEQSFAVTSKKLSSDRKSKKKARRSQP
jgi:HTH-type transcriptional regulator, competence development regulator